MLNIGSPDTRMPDTEPRLLSRVSEHALEQESRRKQESCTRHRAVGFVEQHAPSCRAAAHYLDVSPRTLAYWCSHKARGQLQPRLRGRPCQDPSLEQRMQVEAILQDTGPGLGIPTLQNYCRKFLDVSWPMCSPAIADNSNMIII
jgi:hypothetical protein